MIDYIAQYRSPRHKADAAEAARLRDNLISESYVDGEVLRWRTNDRVPPGDVLAFADYLAHVEGSLPTFSLAKTVETGDAETAAFLEAYRRNQPAEPTPEERVEARAAHGPGVELVDVITGRRFVT